MNLFGRIINYFLKNRRARTAHKNDEAFRAAYRLGPLAGTSIKDKSVVIIYNDIPFYLEISSRLCFEGASVNGVSLLDESKSYDPQHKADFLIMLIRWTPLAEMMRLKTISKETCDCFWKNYVDKSMDIAYHVVSTNQNVKIISLLPSFAFEREYGYTLYGVVGNHLTHKLKLLENKKQSRYINVTYDKAMNEQITAILMLLCREIDIINPRINIGSIDTSALGDSISKMTIYNTNFKSSCGGTLDDSNIIFVYNDKDYYSAIEKQFGDEGCYKSGLCLDSELVEDNLLAIKRKMIGPCDVIINIINSSKINNPIRQMYQWFQVESPFLTKQERNATICTIYIDGNEPENSFTSSSITKLNESLAHLLINHSFVVNGIIAGKSVNERNISSLAAFLCSKYGAALTGETICLR